MNALSTLVSFVAYVAIQVFLLRNVSVFGYAFCFLYVAFLLLLPYQTNLVVVLLLGFVTGLAVDTFYDTAGMHAAACVLVAFVRPAVVRLIVPRSELEDDLQLTLQGLGTYWFVSYAVVMLLIHHAALFLLEAATPALFGLAALKTLASVAFTTLVLLLTQSFRR